MKQLYTAPWDTVQTTPPQGMWHAVQCPGLPQWALVVVERWATDAAEEVWLAAPQVTERYPENLGQLIPAVMVTAFGPWGILATDTLREALRKIRTQWPAARL